MKSLLFFTMLLFVSFTGFCQPAEFKADQNKLSKEVIAKSTPVELKTTPVTLQAQDWLYLSTFLNETGRSMSATNAAQRALRTASTSSSTSAVQVTHLTNDQIIYLAQILRYQPYTLVVSRFQRIDAALKRAGPQVASAIAAMDASSQAQQDARMKVKLESIKQNPATN